MEHQYPSRAHLEDAMNPVLTRVHQPLGLEQRQPTTARPALDAAAYDAVAHRSARPDLGRAA